MSAERLPFESRQNLEIKNSMCCSLPRMPPRASSDVGIDHYLVYKVTVSL